MVAIAQRGRVKSGEALHIVQSPNRIHLAPGARRGVLEVRVRAGESPQRGEARQRAVERVDLEELPVGGAAVAGQSEQEILALERATVGDRPFPPNRDHEAVAVDRRPGPADLEPLVRRQLPERDVAVEVGLRTFDAAEACMPMILEDDVIGVAGA